MNEVLPDEGPPNLSDYSEPLVTKVTTLENFPSPFANPKECNRMDLRESYVCDPGNGQFLLVIRHRSNAY